MLYIVCAWLFLHINVYFLNLKIKSHDQADRLEIYTTTLEVLEPQVEQLRAMLHFQVKQKQLKK